jgi:hypothetical protein
MQSETEFGTSTADPPGRRPDPPSRDPVPPVSDAGFRSLADPCQRAPRGREPIFAAGASIRSEDVIENQRNGRKESIP